MPIYRYTPASNDFNTLERVSIRGDLYSKFVTNKKISSKWRPIKVRVDKHGHRGEFPSFEPAIPVFTQKALNVLQPFLGDTIEALPLNCGRFKFYAIHVLNVVDCFDEKRSDFNRFPSGGIMYINKHVFKEKCLDQQLMFRISQAPIWGVYYTERFKQLLDEANLKGLNHRKVFP